MKDFVDHLMDTESFAKALESIQLKPKEKDDLGELYTSKRGVSVTRDKGNGLVKLRNKVMEVNFG